MADIPREVIVKLMTFTIAMIVFPLVTFFSVQQFTSNTILSGGLAAGAANIVLVLYCIMAFSESAPEQSDAAETKKEK